MGFSVYHKNIQICIINLGYSYKQWALKHEKTCISKCLSYGYNEHTMIKCSGFCNAYHYECLKKWLEITKKPSEKQDDELICNIWQLCLYLRN